MLHLHATLQVKQSEKYSEDVWLQLLRYKMLKWTSMPLLCTGNRCAHRRYMWTHINIASYHGSTRLLV